MRAAKPRAWKVSAAPFPSRLRCKLHSCTAHQPQRLGLQAEAELSDSERRAEQSSARHSGTVPGLEAWGAAARWGAVPDGWGRAGVDAIWSAASPRRESLAHGALGAARLAVQAALLLGRAVLKHSGAAVGSVGNLSRLRKQFASSGHLFAHHDLEIWHRPNQLLQELPLVHSRFCHLVPHSMVARS